jgi:hypothetical protein
MGQKVGVDCAEPWKDRHRFRALTDEIDVKPLEEVPKAGSNVLPRMACHQSLQQSTSWRLPLFPMGNVIYDVLEVPDHVNAPW